MPRANHKVASHRRRRKFIKLAKGYWGARSKVWTVAKHHIEKGLQYAYRDRRRKKREFRSLWITRINAAARLNGTTYSRLINALSVKGITINRKVLADFAMNQPQVFTAIVKKAMS
ncbi:MAG: 50S ribosomal protein L20 [Candidatus Kapaibacterium sp.]|jgi:large subunit ribosomal protein L20|nr:50S ribosomal protein L20 [Ignavibacteria bacterium]MBN8573169.1 50S ribosomal protein L20 [Candidatus Kapabacteria bacterium]HRE58987.1 50S ribosomal protein L20 [Candidatus Kapabacteria bacterium]HRI31959.1 50S ribosomal protein L20 [Candidatus Kapabacteria bacterium]HRK59728.1 50S ribosomal protein L20 [Candidatus Kapabacteria bacterium]